MVMQSSLSALSGLLIDGGRPHNSLPEITKCLHVVTVCNLCIYNGWVKSPDLPSVVISEEL